MLYNAKEFYQTLSDNYSWRRLHTEPNKNVNARLIDKINITNNDAKKLILHLTNNNNNISKSNYEKHKSSYFYNDIDFKNYKQIIKRNATPIEKRIRKSPHKDENLYHIFSNEKIDRILNKKLKPTPFQKNQAKYILGKKTILIKQYLHNSSDIDGMVLQNIALPHVKKTTFHYFNNKNKIINPSFSMFKTFKKNSSLLKKKVGQYYFNSKNLEYTEKIIKRNQTTNN